MEKKELNLHQKLIEVRKQVPYIQKNADGFNFKYVQGSVLLGLLKPKMDELGVLLSYDIEEMKTENVEKNIRGKNVLTGRTTAKFVFTFVNADKPGDEIRKTLWFQIIGDDIQDVGSMCTYALRYFLLGFFNIPSDKDDPDTFEKSKERSQPVEHVTAEQLEEIEELINGHDDIRQRMVKTYKELKYIPADYYKSVITGVKKLIKDKEKRNENN